jgi:LacI family transcriptional regulator
LANPRPKEVLPPRSIHKATLRDVAEHAGVSTATVSRCLNNPNVVQERLRLKVAASIQALRYTPHAAARALASRRSGLIGAVVPTAAHSLFGGFIHALEDTLCEVGYGMLLANSHYDTARELTQAEHLLGQGIDGLVLVGETHADVLYQRLADEQVPFVNTWTFSENAAHPCVGFDNEASARAVAEYLIGLGHKHFAVIAGDTRTSDRAAQRLSGVQHALRDRGLALPKDRVVNRPYDIGEGRAAMRLLMSYDPRPTAVICGNDVLAFGALFECRALGLGVPEDVSITGFDDLEVASQLAPPLTTVRVPADEMGRRAASFLLGRLRHEPAPNMVRLEANLIVRGTTSAPRTSGGRSRR